MVYIKRITVLMLVLLLSAVLRLTAVTASAETLAFISVPESVKRGDSFNVTLSFDADTPIGLVETDLVYDDSMAAFTDGSASGSGGVLHVKEVSAQESLSLTVVLTFTASAPGDLSFTLSNCRVSSPDGAPLAEVSASASLAVTESSPDDSENSEQSGGDQSSVSDKDENGIPYRGVLTSITVSAGELIPEFSPLIYDYVVKVGHEVEVFEVDAVLRYEHDYIWFEGSKKLSETGTVRKITVCDTDPTDETQTPTYKNVYTITVERDPAPEESSEAEETVSSEEESSAAQDAVVTASDIPADTSEETVSHGNASSDSSKSSTSAGASGMAELRTKLMPWLIVILGVLILALVIIIIWIRNKSDRKRRRIKSSYKKK